MTEFGEDVGPGDITVTLVHSGFLIGRVMPQDGAGPWWEYIRTVADQDEANFADFPSKFAFSAVAEILL